MIGMGRIVGDGGWVFHESTLPFFQRIRKGLRKRIMKELKHWINKFVSKRDTVLLFVNERPNEVHKQFGFVETSG